MLPTESPICSTTHRPSRFAGVDNAVNVFSTVVDEVVVVLVEELVVEVDVEVVVGDEASVLKLHPRAGVTKWVGLITGGSESVVVVPCAPAVEVVECPFPSVVDETWFGKVASLVEDAS